MKSKLLYVVAVNLQEAVRLADDIGHMTRKAAEQHLTEVKAPPTDPCYTYRIFAVPREKGVSDV